ncbi:unnamed protein product [marine sediment metagenome]|uniref:Uncharacterized protein n=1 Tax=marine sediment metagenome TaxID=412755 RepID=X0SJR5_9ZZZZ
MKHDPALFTGANQDKGAKEQESVKKGESQAFNNGPFSVGCVC